MLITATQKYTRQTPRKVRLVANTVKKMPLLDALRQLSVIEKRSTEVVAKVMRQAIADAVHNHGFQPSQLTIENILINEGPRYRRFQPVSRGRAHGIIKRSSHVTVILKSIDEAVKSAKPKAIAPAAAEKSATVEKSAKPASKPTAKPKATPVKKVVAKKKAA